MWVTWDPVKDRSNRRKHGISFGQARAVFDDPLAVSVPDPDAPEERWITVGHAGSLGLLVVVHTYREHQGREFLRIISARMATRRERRKYEEG